MYTLDRNLFFFEFYENCDEKINKYYVYIG